MAFDPQRNHSPLDSGHIQPNANHEFSQGDVAHRQEGCRWSSAPLAALAIGSSRRCGGVADSPLAALGDDAGFSGGSTVLMASESLNPGGGRTGAGGVRPGAGLDPGPAIRNQSVVSFVARVGHGSRGRCGIHRRSISATGCSGRLSSPGSHGVIVGLYS